MGFFSQNCTAIECGESIIAPYDIPAGLQWQNTAVVITANGSIVSGSYDGYGEVDGHPYAIGGTGTVWHQRCWEAAGAPSDYRGESEPAHDQGFFYDRTSSRRAFLDG